MYDLKKRFFKMTLEQFRSSAKQQEQQQGDLMQRFNDICMKIDKQNQLNDVDLFELTTEYRRLVYSSNSEKKSYRPSVIINANENKAAGVAVQNSTSNSTDLNGKN